MKKNIYLLLLSSLITISYCNFARSQEKPPVYQTCSNSTVKAKIQVEKSGVRFIICAGEKIYLNNVESLTNSTSSNTIGGASNRQIEIQDYSNLADAVSAIGTTKKLLNINRDMDCSSPMTLPKNLNLEFTNSGKIVKRAGCTLVINGQIKADRVNIFSGFSTANQLKIPGANDVIYPEWFGAVGDGITDDYAAIQLMFDAVEYNIGGLPASGGYYTGGKFRFAGGKVYYSSQEFRVRRSVEIEGVGGRGQLSATKISFAYGKKGFVFENYSSEREAQNAAMTAGSQILNANLNFIAADVGKRLVVFGAADSTILSVQSATQATLNAKASATVVNGQAFIFNSSNAGQSKISNLHLAGGTGNKFAATHQIDINGSKITRKMGEVIDRYRGYGEGTTFTMNNVEWTLAKGDTVILNGSVTANSDVVSVANGTVDGSYLDAYVSVPSPRGDAPTFFRIAEVINSTRFRINKPMPVGLLPGGSTVPFSVTPLVLKGYRFVALGAESKLASNIVRTTRGAMENSLVGATIRVGYKDYLIDKVINANTIAIKNLDNSAVSIPYFASEAEIIKLAPRTNQSVRFNIFHGIDAKVPVEINNVYITYFAGNGINFDSSLASGLDGIEPNQNNGNVTRNVIYENKGHGIYLRGTNSNTMTIANNDVSNNRGWGFYDISQHGNNYLGNHTSYNANGSRFSFVGGVSRSQYTGEYCEGGEPSNIISQGATWLGGVPGCQFSEQSSQGAVMLSDEGNGKSFLINAIRTQSILPRTPNGDIIFNSYTTTQIGQGGRTDLPVLMGFGNSDEIASTQPKPYPTLSYFLTYATENSRPAGGWYAMQHNQGTRTNNSDGYTAFAFSGAKAAEGAAQFWLPNGFFIGRDTGGLTRSKIVATALGLSLDKNFKANSFQLDSLGTRPTCTAETRGTFWVNKGGAGVADVPQMCLKNAEDTFSWRNIAVN